MSIDKISIGYKIRKIRQSKDLRQTEFAKILGVSQSTISLIETNLAEPDQNLIDSIEKSFNCCIQDKPKKLPRPVPLFPKEGYWLKHPLCNDEDCPCDKSIQSYQDGILVVHSSIVLIRGASIPQYCLQIMFIDENKDPVRCDREDMVRRVLKEFDAEEAIEDEINSDEVRIFFKPCTAKVKEKP